MAASLLDDPDLMQVDEVHDTANKQKYKEKKDAIFETQVFFVQSTGPKGDKALLIFDGRNGGPDAPDGPEMDLLTDAVGGKVRGKLWEWIGEDRRTLRFNAWRMGQGKNTSPVYVKFEQPPVLAPGDCFTGGVAVNSGRALPKPACTMAIQVNLDVTFTFYGDEQKPPKYEHGCFFGGDAITRSPWSAVGAPEEERISRGMPYELQLLPRIFISDEEEKALYVSTAFTPPYAQKNRKPQPRADHDVFKPQPAERSLVRLPVNRAQRVGTKVPANASRFLLPDESYLLAGKVTGGALVSVSKCNDQLLVAKGTGEQRWAVEEQLTLDVAQTRPDMDGKERFTLTNISVYADRLLQAFGIPFAPLLAAIMRNPVCWVPYDILMHLSVIDALTKPENQEGGADDREAAYPQGCFTGKQQRLERVTARMAEWGYYNGVRVSLDLMKRRYDNPVAKYLPVRDDRRGLVDSEEIWTECINWGFGIPQANGGKTKPPNWKPQTDGFTWARNPGWIPLDVQTVQDFAEHGEEYDYFGMMLTASESLGVAFPEQVLAPDISGGRSPTRLTPHTPEQGDAFVLDFIAKQNKPDAEAIRAGTCTKLQVWMQATSKSMSEPKAFQLPWISFFAVKKGWAPSDPLSYQPSVIARMAKKRPLADGEDRAPEEIKTPKQDA